MTILDRFHCTYIERMGYKVTCVLQEEEEAREVYLQEEARATLPQCEVNTSFAYLCMCVECGVVCSDRGCIACVQVCVRAYLHRVQVHQLEEELLTQLLRCTNLLLEELDVWGGGRGQGKLPHHLPQQVT